MGLSAVATVSVALLMLQGIVGNSTKAEWLRRLAVNPLPAGFVGGRVKIAGGRRYVFVNAMELKAPNNKN